LPAAGAELTQVGQPLLQLAELTVIQASRRLLAIARHEGHRGAIVQKADRGAGLFRPAADLAGDDAGDGVER
jgi:hypothetical protein